MIYNFVINKAARENQGYTTRICLKRKELQTVYLSRAELKI